MRQTFQLKINTNQINRALSRINERVDDVSMDALNEIADKGREYATELYKHALYDGEHDAVVLKREIAGARTVEITAVGNSVNFIEYGTGIFTGGEYGTGKDQWYFSKKGRDVKLTSGTGDKATYMRGGYERHYYISTSGKKHYISANQETSSRTSNYDSIIYKDGVPVGLLPSYKSRSQNTNYQPRFNYVIQSEWVPQEEVVREDSFVTKGNPPNNVMHKTRDYMAEIAPEIVRKHLKKAK